MPGHLVCPSKVRPLLRCQLTRLAASLRAFKNLTRGVYVAYGPPAVAHHQDVEGFVDLEATLIHWPGRGIPPAVLYLRRP